MSPWAILWLIFTCALHAVILFLLLRLRQRHEEDRVWAMSRLGVIPGTHP